MLYFWTVCVISDCFHCTLFVLPQHHDQVMKRFRNGYILLSDKVRNININISVTRLVYEVVACHKAMIVLCKLYSLTLTSSTYEMQSFLLYDLWN